MLSLTRELDEAQVVREDLEKSRRQLQNELDELVNSQGTADKNVSAAGLGKRVEDFSRRWREWTRRGCWRGGGIKCIFLMFGLWWRSAEIAFQEHVYVNNSDPCHCCFVFLLPLV